MALTYHTAGESHGPALTIILQGMPAGIPLTAEMINHDLAQRQLKAGAGARMVIETDQVALLSGIMAGQTTGAPIAMTITNRDHAAWQGKAVLAYTTPRPGHADCAAVTKYRYDDIRPSLERASARETACRVAMGAICRAYLGLFGIEIRTFVATLGDCDCPTVADPTQACDFAATSPIKAPSADHQDAYQAAILAARQAGETLGGTITCVATGLPTGLGSFTSADKRLDARLAGALISIQAMKGVEIGSAFENTRHPGSHVHDAITQDGRPTNRCGGIEGGMSTGAPVISTVAMKPIPTTLVKQESFDLSTHQPAQTTYERSDTAPVPRACVVVESMTAFVLADALLEKLGGDSIIEQLPRFKALPTMRDIHLDPQPKVFW